MFIIPTVSKESATGRIKEIYEQMEEALGFLPPHTELFATLDIQGLEEFFALNIHLLKHPRIDADILPFLRLFIAQKECRGYCTTFNSKLLLVKRELLKNLQTTFHTIPVEKTQCLLAQKVLQALYEKFEKADLEELKAQGFEEQDFYDLLNYITIFMAKSKIIDIYLEK